MHGPGVRREQRVEAGQRIGQPDKTCLPGQIAAGPGHVRVQPAQQSPGRRGLVGRAYEHEAFAARGPKKRAHKRR